MIDTQSSPVSFSEAVLLRPAMYTLGGTFGEVIAFLEGYYSGMAKADLYAPPVHEWHEFRKWLSNQLDADAAETFSAFFACYTDSQTALKALYEKLRYFCEVESKRL